MPFRTAFSVIMVLGAIGLIALTAGWPKVATEESVRTPEPSLESRLKTIDSLLDDYRAVNEDGQKPSDELVSSLLSAGSELVLAVPRFEREGVEVDDKEVKERLRLIPLFVGCTPLDITAEDQLRRINIYLSQNHRPMCGQCQARSAYIVPGGTPVINEVTTGCCGC